MSPRFAVFSGVFALIFGFSLYLLVCTASISPKYQPDIHLVRWFSPFLVLIVSFIFVTRLAQCRQEVIRFLQLSLILCTIVFVLVVAGQSHRSETASIPADHGTLAATLGSALAHPQFSNRSFAPPVYCGGLVGILSLVHRNMSRRREQNV